MRSGEMFVILDGEAEFTVDGRTSLIKGPAAVPDRMGHAHAIYNPGDKPIQWMNINVGMGPNYDTFDLGDTRVGAPLDPVPQFPNMRFDQALLRPASAMDGGQGTVQYRRGLGPTIFSTPWAYVDHLVIPPGASVGSRALPAVRLATIPPETKLAPGGDMPRLAASGLYMNAPTRLQWSEDD